jgi:hypothetical protein
MRRVVLVAAIAATMAGFSAAAAGVAAPRQHGAPVSDQCVDTDPLVVLGMEVLPAQHRCVPVL